MAISCILVDHEHNVLHPTSVEFVVAPEVEDEVLVPGGGFMTVFGRVFDVKNPDVLILVLAVQEDG